MIQHKYFEVYTFKNLQTILTLVIFGLLCGSCSCTKELPTIKIGISPWPGYESVFMAQKMGYFEKNGLRVEIKEFSSLSDTITAFQRGQINAMCSTVLEAIAVWQNSGVAPKIIAVLDYSNGPDAILSNQNIQSIGELKGKSIAVEAGGLGSYILTRALSKTNLALADVTVMPTDQSAMEKLVQTGKADAVISYPPYSINFLNKHGMKVIFSSKDLPEEIVDIVSIDAKILTDSPKIRELFLKSLQESLEYIDANQDQAYTLMAKRENITKEEFIESVSGLKIHNMKEQSNYFGSDQKLKKLLAMINAVNQSSSPPSRKFNADEFLP